MKKRKISIIGTIDEAMVAHVSEQLDIYEVLNATQPIHIELYSHGGNAGAALAIVGRLRSNNMRSIITVFGRCESAAVVILAACDERRMHKDAWVMVHEDSCKTRTTTGQARKLALQMEREEAHFSRLLAEYTSTGYKAWRSMHYKETCLSAQQCLSLGLIDTIIKGRPRA